MINANELRRGNKVISKTHNILNATFEGLAPQNLVFLKEVSTFETLDKLEPILLTPEILESAGFEKSKAEWEDGYYYFKYPVTIYADGEVKRLTVGMNGVKHKYLHQLQNLYFALTGQELEISL